MSVYCPKYRDPKTKKLKQSRHWWYEFVFAGVVAAFLGFIASVCPAATFAKVSRLGEPSSWRWP